MTNPDILSRPKSLAEWFERAQRLSFPLMAESTKHGLTYQAQPTDLFISPYGKCGTTWLQQIIHSLRTGGDMDFDDISRVLPYLEAAYALGIDLYAPQRGAFQAFKCHLSWHDVPKGGRYIVSVRNPKDALISGYHFLNDWYFADGAVSISEFARDLYMIWRGTPQGYWYHLDSWWAQRHDEHVLLLCYEEMRQDLPGTVQTIAHFLGMEIDEALLALVVKHASLDFMLAHKEQFDDRLMREFNVKIGQLPPGGDAIRVRKGRVGDHRLELPADISAEMDAIWQEEITAKWGLASYQDLRAAIVAEARKF